MPKLISVSEDIIEKLDIVRGPKEELSYSEALRVYINPPKTHEIFLGYADLMEAMIKGNLSEDEAIIALRALAGIKLLFPSGKTPTLERENARKRFIERFGGA